jgi:hypothetical protein
MLSVVTLNVVALSVVMPSVIMLGAIMLRVVMLSVAMLSVMASMFVLKALQVKITCVEQMKGLSVIKLITS